MYNAKVISARAKKKKNLTKWDSLVIKKDREARARLWRANHGHMAKHLRKLAGLDDEDRIDPRTIMKFQRITFRKCSLRA